MQTVRGKNKFHSSLTMKWQTDKCASAYNYIHFMCVCVNMNLDFSYISIKLYPDLIVLLF